MKILVAVKRVVDPYIRIRVRSDGAGVDTTNTKMAMNPFDEIALEEAIRLKEKNIASEILIVSIGDTETQETLRHGLALGADRAILVATDGAKLCSLNIAKILHKIVIKEDAQLILMGKQSIDSDSNQAPQMLAGLLNWPQATYASKVEISDNSIFVSREVDAGIEEIQVSIPAVISADLRLNEPRYASLPNIMKAKQKPLDVISIESLDLNLSKHLEVLDVSCPASRSKGEMVDSVSTLLDKLQHEAKVI